jgi:hypothetical protein
MTPMYGTKVGEFDLATAPAHSVKPKKTLINFFICLFILGWVTQEFALFNVGKYSMLLVYFAAIPFCRRITQRSVMFVLLPLISTALAALVGFYLGGVNPAGIASQAALQLLAIALAAGVASIDWRKHFLPLTKALIVLGVPIVAFGGYQMLARARHLPYAFLPVTNQQEYADGGLQRGWEKEQFTRASSIFVEPSEFGYFCLWLLLVGLSMTKGPWRVCAIVLAFSGMLFSQSLSGALGLAILFAAYLAVNRISFTVVRQVAIVAIASVMAVFAIAPLMPDAFDAFSQRIQQAVTLDDRADSGRVDHLPANWRNFMEEPLWGHGLASASSAEANGIDVTTFTYFLILIERGMVGTALFFAPWLWLGWRSVRLPPSDPMRTPCVLLSALNLYSFATSSVAYSLPYWFALGICASCVLATHLPATRLALSGWFSLGDPNEAVSETHRQ